MPCVEGAHAKLKLDLISSQGSFLTLVEACTAIEDYGREASYALSIDRSHVPTRWQKEIIFSDIVRKIAGKALELVCGRLPEPR